MGTVGYSNISTLCDDLRPMYRSGVEEMLSNLLSKADLRDLESSRILVILRGPGERLMVTYTEQLLRSMFDGRIVGVMDIFREEGPVELIGVMANIPPERFGIRGVRSLGESDRKAMQEW